jgi:transcriptional regulator with XRE-family HTH domain
MGLSQGDLGALVRVARRTVIDWECGKSVPTPKQWAALVRQGVDLRYVEEGVLGVPSVSPTMDAVWLAFEALPEGEREAFQQRLHSERVLDNHEQESGG